VHRATLADGRRVAVKVRRPGVRTDIDVDLALLRSLLSLATRVSRRVRTYDPAALLEEFADMLRGETDTTLQDMKLGRVLGELFHVLRRYGLVLPADLAILLKTVIECEGTTSELEPAFAMNDFLAELPKSVAVINTGSH
jgi:predicted unusual protein kinase regulating ubiquinone biosynthesis (AarF/ABC1/UbiB family)